MRQPPRVTTIELGKLMEIQAGADQAAGLREELKKANLANQLADKILVKALDDRHAALDRAEKAEAALAEAQKNLRDQRDAQGMDGNWNCSPYMLGIYNGLECALATMEGRAPQYRKDPEKFLNSADNATLSARVKELEEALRFYARPWVIKSDPIGAGLARNWYEPPPELSADTGARARAALNTTGGE